MNVQVSRVDNAGEELNHLHLCQMPFPRAADLEGCHQVVGVHQHVDERVAQCAEVAVTTAMHLKFWVQVGEERGELVINFLFWHCASRESLTLVTTHQAQAIEVW